MAQTEGLSIVDGYLLQSHYDKHKLETRVADTFNFRPNDVIVAGFPKSGNTWLVEVLKAMYTDWGLEIFDEAASAVFFEERTVFNSYFCMKRQRLVETIKCEDIPSPRLMRTHLPATLFPCAVLKDKGAKAIYISRNPKDVVVSTYYFYKSLLHGALSTGSWEQTVQSFVEDRLLFTPWVRHVGDWFKKGIEDDTRSAQRRHENGEFSPASFD
ncbi:sulfotransferase 1 family member D1-like [Ptychodera flava]|uniref:sulfotransferase 1 family member D1-like n=1 Tax=Ptychodera flava TaxID=63121 RepID=UPI003969CF22